MWNDFKAFVMRGNVLDLAVGVIIGAAFGSVVQSLVSDVLLPPLGVATGGVDFTDKFVLLKPGATAAPPYASLAAARQAGAVTLNYGAFVNSVVTFGIVALAIFALVRAVNRLYRRPADPTANTRPCPYCTMSVAVRATRCPHCTSELVPTSPATA